MPGLCPVHGPYDGAQCSYCVGEGNRPPAPGPIDDDIPTDLGAAAVNRMGGGYGQGDMPTDLNYNRGGGAGGYEEEGTTDISANRQQRGGKMFDYDEEKETELGHSRMDDHTEIEIAVSGPLGLLWVSRGKRRGHTHQIKDNTVVGRKKGGLVIDDPKISDPHAKFTIEEDEFVLWDFGSTNGTYVNGERIRGATALLDGDEIKMGDSYFIFKVLPDLEKPKKRTWAKAARPGGLAPRNDGEE